MIKHQFIFEETGVDSQAAQAQVAEIVVPATEVTLPATIEKDIQVAINTVKNDALNAINTAADRLITSQAAVTINADYPANSQCIIYYTADYDCIINKIDIISGLSSISAIKVNNNDIILPYTLRRNDTLFIYATTNDINQSLSITRTLLVLNQQLYINSYQYTPAYMRTTPCYGGVKAGNLTLFISGTNNSTSMFVFRGGNVIHDYLGTYISNVFNYIYIAEKDCIYILGTNQSSIRPYYVSIKQLGSIVNLNYATYNQLYIPSRRSVFFQMQLGFIEVSIDTNTVVRTVVLDAVTSPGYMQVVEDRYLYIINENQSRLLCYDLLNDIVLANIALPYSYNYYPRICIYEPSTKRLFIGYGGQAQPIRVVNANPQSPTFNQLIASVGNYLIQWAMTLANGYIYFCDNNQMKIYRLNPSNYSVEQLSASILPGTNYAFADSSNVYFTSSNGWIYTLPL